ncbi:MlaD family protein [Rugosimonospora acidiphila]|uniref:MlaD family protein n=1 Tax=Rugosimonospora acidiphila TaxID=556531 RepID=A0ABP9SQ33_9ACTN
MITRTVKFQVLVFLVVSLLGVSYVGLRYVGLGDRLFGDGYTVHADFAAAGGIFTNAAVTYRGIPVGRVGAVRLAGKGVRVDLDLRGGVPIPRDLHAVTAERSAVGEQYVDLRPDTDTGPYLRDGDTIPASRTSVPLPVETLLTNLDGLVRSVDGTDLSTLIDELGTAFEGNEDALRQIVDAANSLLATANQDLPQTLTLIQDGRTVLNTQAGSADAIHQWARSLSQLTGTVKNSDGDLRRLLADEPPGATQLVGLLRDLDPSVGTLLGNLITVNGIAADRLPGIRQILVEYPVAVAGGFTVAPGDGTAHFGLVVNLNNPPACQYTSTGADACTAKERAAGSGVRGSTEAPEPSGTDPSPAPVGAAPSSGGAGSGGSPSDATGTGATGTIDGFDPATGLVTGADGLPLQLGGTGGQYALAGNQSWKELLLAGLAG